MNMQRVGRAAAWLAVLVVAMGTTAPAVLCLSACAGVAAPVLGLTELGRSTRLAVGAAALLLSLAPWWALVAVLVQRDRRRNGAAATQACEGDRVG